MRSLRLQAATWRTSISLLAITPRRQISLTPLVLAEASSKTSPKSNAVRGTSAAGTGQTTAPPRAGPSASTATHAKRGEQIRRNEALFRWLRRLVVPAFSIWGLYVLRPTEGHFLRYMAERRHLDTEFNAWFPPVTAAARSDAPNSPSKTTEKRAAGEKLATLHKVDVEAAFRTPQDRDWAAQKFNYKKGSEDEERVARRRLLFARERAYLPDDTVVETIRSPEAQMEELRASREHPPMHLLSEQLDAMVEESKVFDQRAAVSSSTANAATPPCVYIHFEDRTLFATAEIVFRDRDGKVGHTMHFVGACGMLWKQLS